MRRILTLPSTINAQVSLQRTIQSLTFKPVYYARFQGKGSKRNNRKQKAQQNTTDEQNNQEPNQQINKPEQPKPDVRITGPKRLLQLLRQGNTNIIPFYVRNMLKNTRNLSLPFTQKDQDNQAAKTKQHIQNSQSYVKQQPPKKTVEYPLKSSLLFRQRLMKKYRIVQSLKGTKRLSRWFINVDLMRTFNLGMLLKDPTRRSFVYRVAFYALFLVSILLYSGINVQKIMPYPNWYIQKNNQMSDSQIQGRINDIKQVRVRTNSHHDSQMTVVLNQQRSLNVFERLFSLLGFEVDRSKTFSFDTQNPNLILDGLQKVQQNQDPKTWVKIKPVADQYQLSDAFFDTLFLSTPFIGLAITYWIFRKINPDAMMKGLTSNKKSMKIESTKDIKVRFKDVAGMQGAKKQITEFVDFLKKSDKYVEMGAKIPKGALLTGPPGTGKTMLAKACAGQAGTSFFYVSGSQFVEMFVGLGASRVRQLFARARAQAPSIIFIDQIDAIGKKRQTSRNEQKDSTLNQMLVQMDGFSSSQTVIVLAATNRKDTLDSALTRPGRFDRIVQITLPQIKARQQIFMVHLAPLKVNPIKPLSQIAKRLAELTPGFSGADIANLCNEAAIIATRKKRTHIEDADFQEASQRIMAGYVKKGLSNQKTRKRVAYHEAGHAVCGWYLRGGDPLVKLTIIPRSKGALGYAQYLPKTAYIRTKSQLIDQIAIMLGGTTTEQLFLGNMSSGNSDDLQKVYSLARRMITQFGMGEKTYNLTLDEQTYVKKESQKLCDVMDQQILDIVNEGTRRAKQIIEEKRHIVEQLAEELLAKQTINNEDILRIMGQRPVFS